MFVPKYKIIKTFHCYGLTEDCKFDWAELKSSKSPKVLIYHRIFSFLSINLSVRSFSAPKNLAFRSFFLLTVNYGIIKIVKKGKKMPWNLRGSYTVSFLRITHNFIYCHSLYILFVIGLISFSFLWKTLILRQIPVPSSN